MSTRYVTNYAYEDIFFFTFALPTEVFTFFPLHVLQIKCRYFFQYTYSHYGSRVKTCLVYCRDELRQSERISRWLRTSGKVRTVQAVATWHQSPGPRSTRLHKLVVMLSVLLTDVRDEIWGLSRLVVAPRAVERLLPSMDIIVFN